MSMTGAVNDQASAYPASGADAVAGRAPRRPTTGRACRAPSTSVPASIRTPVAAASRPARSAKAA